MTTKPGEPGYQPKKIFGRPNDRYIDTGPEAASAKDKSGVLTSRPSDDFGGDKSYYGDIFYDDLDEYPLWNEEDDIEGLEDTLEDELSNDDSSVIIEDSSHVNDGTPQEVAQGVLSLMPRHTLLTFQDENGGSADLSMVCGEKDMVDLVSNVYAAQDGHYPLGAEAQWGTLQSVGNYLASTQSKNPHVHLGAHYLDCTENPLHRVSDALAQTGYDLSTDSIVSSCVNDMREEYSDDIEHWSEEDGSDKGLYSLIYDEENVSNVRVYNSSSVEDYIEDYEEDLYLDYAAQETLRLNLVSHVNNLCSQIRQQV